MRFVPMRGGLSPIEAMLLDRCHEPPSPGSWEFGRLVLDPRYRNGPALLQKCVFLAVSHLVASSTDCEHAYASCNHVLGRLYRRFGFSVIAGDVLVPGEQRPFSLIRACVADILMSSASDDSERALARSLAAR